MSTLVMPDVVTHSKWTHGSAIKNGKIRFLSVSQVVKFDPEMDGGCPRRWWFIYVDGKKEETSEAARLGTQFAKEGEIYLKTNADVLGEVMLAGRHLMPKPGPDLEVEAPLGDFGGAVKLRDELLQNGDSVELREKIDIVSGLAVHGIPFTGAPDFRHRRGEYINEYGILSPELPGYVVAEVGDHKTTSRIKDHVSKTGKIYKGNAKSVEQILNHVQMIGYGMNTIAKYRDLTHVRLSHLYYQTRNTRTAEKRTGLISVDQVRSRWRRVERIVDEMVDAANTTNPDQVPYNTNSCFAYHKDCPHSAYCNRPNATMSDIYQGERSMGIGLFGSSSDTAPTNGISQHSPPSVPPPQMTDEQHRAATETAKQQLLGMTPPVVSFGFCSKCGMQLTSANASSTPSGVQHIGCAATQFAAPSTPVAPVAPTPPPAPTAVNPADSPPYDPIAAATALTPEAIAAIQNPALRQQTEEHARAAAARTAAEAQAAAIANPTAVKTSGRCPAAGQVRELTDKEKTTHHIKCEACGKDLKITKHFSPDFKTATVPGHLMAKPVATAAPAPQVPAIPAAPVAPIPPAAVAPTPPVQQVAPMPPPPPAPTPPTLPPPAVTLPSAAASSDWLSVAKQSFDEGQHVKAQTAALIGILEKR